jgi:hypothetical protein
VRGLPHLQNEENGKEINVRAACCLVISAKRLLGRARQNDIPEYRANSIPPHATTRRALAPRDRDRVTAHSARAAAAAPPPPTLSVPVIPGT